MLAKEAQSPLEALKELAFAAPYGSYSMN